MEFKSLPVDQIFVEKGFNARNDIGDLEDLENSLLEIGGNIAPIGVYLVGKKYKLIFGERRLLAAKNINLTEINCQVFDSPDEEERIRLMVHENLGRKDLDWREQAVALKRWLQCNDDHRIKTVKENLKVSTQSAWKMLTAVKAIEEFPELVNETDRNVVLKKYEILKQLPEKKKQEIKSKKTSVAEVMSKVKKEDLAVYVNHNKAVIEELKDEIKSIEDNIYSLVSRKDKNERIENGIWLKSEVKVMIDACRTCEDFGKLSKTSEECHKCHTETPNIFSKCEFYQDEFAEGKK